MKKVILTIDTEGHDGIHPVENLIWGKTNEGLFGIDRIMNICDKYGVRGLFFVDIAEAWDYGEEKIAEVILHILNKGHDVGVHIHPDHMADKNRLFLWEYSKGEQYEIIKRCTDFFVKITGEWPTAFRAGKYGANRDTLDILSDLGYKYDFSQFYRQKWCGITPPVTENLPCEYKYLKEIPVTVYRSFKLGRYDRIDKIDATMDSNEFKYIMNKMKSLSDNIIISLFYHSFSMLNWRDNPNAISFNKSEEKKLINAIEYVVHTTEYSFICYNELIREKINTEVVSNNVIFTNRNLVTSIWFVLLRAFGIRKYNKKANLLINSAFWGSLSVIIITLVIILM